MDTRACFSRRTSSIGVGVGGDAAVAFATTSFPARPAASDDDDDARWKRRGGATTARAALRSSVSAPRRGGMAAASPRAVR
jgi:hypothetical protein